MYTTFFGLHEQPFNITPNPRFIYASPAHEEAYAALHYGIHERKGLILVTGEAGNGKTTLLRRLVKNTKPNIHIVSIDNPLLSFDELFDSLCQDFALPIEENWRRLEKMQALKKFLLVRQQEKGTGVVLVDEAHALGEHVLETLRLLSNLESEGEKLLQIVLVGQPELEEIITQPQLSQFKQRIAVSCHLGRLKDREVGPFIQHRLAVAGCKYQEIFPPDVIQRIAHYADGNPRLIITICDNALLFAYGTTQHTVSTEIIEEVAHDLLLTHSARESEYPLTVPQHTPDGPSPTGY